MKERQADGAPRSDARPAVRWWWFANEIHESEIDEQLDWVAAQGFGGVEIAWVYQTEPDAPPARFLGPRWSELVAHASRAAAGRGLGCDFTLGTLWPFGGSFVPAHHVSRTATGPSEQRLRRSWEQAYAEPAPILDHLNEDAVREYVHTMTTALEPAISEAKTPALFTDSWEVDPTGLWAEGIEARFSERYGYELRPWIDRLDDDLHRRYDYRTLVSELALSRFFAPLAELCRAAGAAARVQAHGAPTDLLSAYARSDIPESETMLFDPAFALIAASAAAWRGRNLVSCESFTCLYGWVPAPGPAPHQGEERLDDLRLVADAGFANGVNYVVWHGMPFSTAARRARFYASTHVGPDAAFARELPRFNAYLATVSAALREGRAHATVACYLPTEEMRMRGELDEGDQRPSARYHWEMHYARMPAELAGYRPLWVNAEALSEAVVEGVVREGTGRRDTASTIRFDDLTVQAIIVDTEWLPHAAVASLVRLRREGARIILRRRPSEPGTLRHPDYDELVRDLLAHTGSLDDLRPLVQALDDEPLPEFFSRVIDGDAPLIRYFFAHPLASRLRYPVPYGLAAHALPCSRSVTLAGPDGAVEETTLRFGYADAVLVDVTAQGVVFHDLEEGFSDQPGAKASGEE